MILVSKVIHKMDKSAIFLSSGIGKNQGGPSGYIYNLYSGSIENGNPVTVITPNMNIEPTKKAMNNNSSVKKFGVLRSLLYIAKTGIRCRKKYKKELKKYALIHVHSSQDLYYLKKYVGYKGKIVFTPHRPEPYANELLNSYRITFDKSDTPKILQKKANSIEKFSYRNTDHFIFPSVHSKDIYYAFPGFKEYALEKAIDYLITGTTQKQIVSQRDEYRRKLGISNDDFMISFIGRHNKVKGYDILASLSDKLNEERIVTVCAGNIKGAKIPQSERWIELGYINNAPDLMNASDIIVIPNRNTYFDLVILEAFSVGRIVISSATGGNIDIASDTKGLLLFAPEDTEDLMNKINLVKHMSIDERRTLEEDAQSYYNKNCRPPEFAKAYNDIISKILIEDNKQIHEE